jgi:hypothetical protein
LPRRSPKHCIDCPRYHLVYGESNNRRDLTAAFFTPMEFDGDASKIE